MPDYSQGKIYKIIDESNGDVYIGCTTQPLNKRFSGHHLFELYDKNRDDCKISLIEEYPCNCKNELEKREKYFIETNDCINKMKCKTRLEGNFIILINVFKPFY